MKFFGEIISEIIRDLEKEEMSLVHPLLNTKELARKLGNEELLKWAKNELAGYTDERELPKYRILVSVIKGVYKDNYQLYNNLPLFTSMLNPEYLLVKVKMGVEFIEPLIREGEVRIIHQPLISILCERISEGYREMGNDLFEVISANKEIRKEDVENILFEIRSKLLDSMKAIMDEFIETDFENLGIQDMKRINSIIHERLIE